MGAEEDTDGYPMLQGRSYEDFPLIYLCKNYACLGTT